VCGIALALDTIGPRWAQLILRDLAHAPLRFSDLQAVNPGLSPTVLTTRLRDLAAAGLIEQRQPRHPGRPTTYHLVEAARPAVVGVLASLAELGTHLVDTSPLDVDPARAFAAQLTLNARTVLARDSSLEGFYVLDFGIWRNHVLIDRTTMASPIDPPAGSSPDGIATFTPPTTLMRIMGNHTTATQAEEAGQLTIAGNRPDVLELLRLLSIDPTDPEQR